MRAMGQPETQRGPLTVVWARTLLWEIPRDLFTAEGWPSKAAALFVVPMLYCMAPLLVYAVIWDLWRLAAWTLTSGGGQISATNQAAGEAAQALAGLRCAFCHDSLQVEETLECSGCGGLRHVSCVEEAATCPTLGCDGAPRRWLGRERS